MKRFSLSLMAIMLAAVMLCASALAYTGIMTTGGQLPIVTEPYSVTIGTPAIATVTDYENNHLTQYLEERTGVDINVFLFDNAEYKTQFQLMCTSGEKLPDTLWSFSLSAVERESYGAQGYFLPLQDYFADEDLAHYFYRAWQYLSDSEKDITFSAGLSSDGNLYGFPFWITTVADAWSFGMLVNNTFLEALNMDIPTTTDELYDYLIAVRDNDPNGNGKQDEIPLVGHTSWTGDLINILMNSFTYYPNQDSPAELCITDDGTLYLPYTTPEYKEGLRFIHKLYEEKLISDLSFSQDRYGLQAMTDLTGEENPDIVGAAVSHRSYMFASHGTAERRDHYTTLGVIAGPEGVAYSPTNILQPRYNQFITCDCKDPEIIFRMLDMCCDEEATLTIRHGRENEYWRWATDEEVANNKPTYAMLGYDKVLFTTSGMNLAWGQQTNEIWNTNSFTWQPMGFDALGMSILPTEGTALYNTLDWTGGIAKRFGKAPAKLIGNLAYTADEINELGTIQADLKTHVKECATRFVTGEMDIDGDWDSFQAALQTMGMETYLRISQDAYDRAYK